MIAGTTVGLLLLSGLGLIAGQRQPMPLTQGQSLSGHEVLLPTSLKGHAAVIVIGFSHASQKSMERWDKEIGAQVKANPGVPLYNIAVLQDAPKIVRAVIKGGIRAVVPAAGQDLFLTVVQGEDQLKSAVDFSSGDDAYVVVLDAEGNIAFHTHGDPSESAKRQIIEQIK